jgi:hypothetical protein
MRDMDRARCSVWAAGLGLGALVVCGCVGSIGDGGSEPLDPDANPTSACVAPTSAPWRLTVREYSASVTSLIGRDVGGLTSDLPSDVALHGFNNQVAAMTLTPEQAAGFQLGAERVAELVTSDDALRIELMGCDVRTGDRRACLTQFAASFARRAYRRPIEGDVSAPAADSELGRLVSMAEAVQIQADTVGATMYGGMADVAAIITAVLQSPMFLFRTEVGTETDVPEVRKLTGYELATRLSYLIWGEGPDDELLDAAAAGELDTADGLEARTRQMLADPRARAHFEDFFAQWLQLGAIFLGTIDQGVFPQYGPALQDAMYREVQQLVSDFVWTEGTDFMQVFTAPYGYADASLAQVYGVGAPGAEGLGRIEHDPSTQRAGVLGTAGVLSMTSHAREPSVVNRGLLVRVRLLCDEIPPPPPNVPDLIDDPTLSASELQNMHTNDPACAGCHRNIDPIGYGLEMFDALGARRSDPTEDEIRAMPRYIEGVDGSEFYGAKELGELIAGLPQARACVADNFYRWSLGRSTAEEPAECGAEPLREGFEAAGNSVPEMVVALVRSDTFRFKTVESCQ